ncbi:MAG TPA: helix-turn-helix transcriptional regulator, partial [Amycolatopsis sp.]|nr:helix-turn-helix transcriptional regulator [Amycolatopsis sp.]
MAEVENEAAERPDRRTRLGRDLRALREMAGLSGRELAALVKISQSKVSRIESALAVPTLPEVARWCDVVGASDDRREMLITMTEAVFTEVRAWPAGSESRGQQ